MVNYPPKNIYTIYRGRSFTAEWYYAENGKMPAYEFYKQMDAVLRSRFLILVQHLAEASYGTFLPKTEYNIEDRTHGIYAFKPHSARFFNFMTKGKKIIVTNAFSKHSQQLTRQDKEKLKVAIKYSQDYKARCKRGDYYEKS
ncbi:hypothetical protein ACFL6Y_11435 [Elusimicrobiota bacterium]